jgi:L-amino acid N-acyltransferase YncA
MLLSKNNLLVIPYVETQEGYTLPDGFLAGIYQEVVDNNLVSTVFYDAQIRSQEDFICLMQNKANIPVFILTKEGKCACFSWLNGISANSAYGHFCYFDQCGETAVECGEAVLGYWHELFETQGIDVILGSIPVFNQRAAAFIKKIGFTHVGEIPKLFKNPLGERFGANIFYKVLR